MYAGVHDFVHADGTLENGANDVSRLPKCTPIRAAGKWDGDCLRMMPMGLDDFLPVSRCLNKDGTLRVVPADFAAMGGVDGFYIARLKKGQ